MAKRKDTPLAAFLRSWLAWAEKPGKRGKEFKQYLGLCTNTADDDEAYTALLAAFAADNLDESFPFGKDRYWMGAGGKHKDPVRLAWVRYYLARFDADLV